MDYTVELGQQARQPYAAVRATVPMASIGDAMGSLFERLFAGLGAAGIAPAGAVYARYLSVGADEVEFEVAAPLAAEPEASAGTGDLILGVLPATDVATTVHTGPYDRLVDAYTAVDAWLKEHGRQSTGAMWEVYLTDPGTEPDPARWRTLVCYPVLNA